jgi:hypothetical protein
VTLQAIAGTTLDGSDAVKATSITSPSWLL